jgi:cytochrome c peroxidase
MEHILSQLNNKIRNKLVIYSLLFIISLLFCCKKDAPPSEVTYDPTPYNLITPANFPAYKDNPANPLTKEGVSLGRKLYYDPILSSNGLSCSSCHYQSKGFSTPLANSLIHTNLIYNQYFLWDGKINGTVEDAMMYEVEDFFHTDISKLNNNNTYKALFKKAFGVETITSKEAAYALAQFIKTLVSGNSKFDKMLRHEIVFTPSEMNGFIIFYTEKGDCFHCHTIPLLSDNSFRNIGLDNVYTPSNYGRYAVTHNSADMGKFKVPSLRNIELTAPYMHDGRFATLEEVIDHYDSGVKPGPTLDPIMTKPAKINGLNLTLQEKSDLISFLKTFTDSSFINNPELGAP